MKSNLIKIIVICVVIIGAATTLVLLQLNKEGKSDAEKFSEEYENVSKDNIFVYRSASEIIDILKGGTGIVYLGFPECKWCQAYVPILEEIAKEKKVDKIYYYNILEDRKNNTLEYQDIVSELDSVLDKDEEGRKRVYVPDVTFVKNGKIVGHDNETALITEDIDPSEYWNDEKKEALKNKLSNMIELVNDKICTTCN